MYLGCDGKEGCDVPVSIDTSGGGEEVSEVYEGVSDRSGGESLRFLWGDVMKVKALFPQGNKALRQKCSLFDLKHVGRYLNDNVNIFWDNCYVSRLDGYRIV